MCVGERGGGRGGRYITWRGEGANMFTILIGNSVQLTVMYSMYMYLSHVSREW